MNTEDIESRLLAWYRLANSRQRAAGLTWYADARAFCREVSADTGLPLATVAGVVAALSPSTYWELNKRQAEALCRTFAAGGDIDSVPISTYGRQAAKARKIVSEKLLSSTDICKALGRRAFKTWAFYDNLTRKESRAATIDQHIIRALDLEDRWTQGAKGIYDEVAGCIRQVADDTGLAPYQLQAIVWLTYKETGERYSPEEKRDRAVAPF